MQHNTHNVHIEIGKEFCHDKNEVQVHAQLLNKLLLRITRSFGKDTDFPNRNYLITGKRGSGKSTFLENLLKLLLDNKETRTINPDIKFAKLLEYDPSASTGGENYFILNVFAALKTELDHLGSCQCTRQNFPYIDDCRDLIRKLSNGLARRSQGKAPLSGLSMDVVAELTLENSDRDEYIRTLFAELITKMCQMKCISAYIITIDDSDTSSHQCFRVMEALRLYLNHPQIIVLMTGDKNMLLERIREHHFKEFDTNYHQCENLRQDIRMNAVVSHAGQYLLKLFPLYNQHELQNLLTLSRKTEPIILHIKHKCKKTNDKGVCEDVEESKPLRDLVTRAFQETISHNISEIKPFVDQFFCLPLRAILQIVKYWTDDNLWPILFATSNPANEHTISKLYSDKQSIAYSVRMALKRVLQTEISSSRYNFESLLADDGRTFYALMLKHCRDMGDLEHGFYLSGDMGGTKEDHNITMLLAVTFGKIVKNLDGFLSYLLYGPATVSLYAKAVEQYRRAIRKQDITTLNKLQDRFDNYLHVGSWQSATRWARHANMIWCFDSGFEGIHSGILRLRHPDRIKELREFAESRIDSTIKEGRLLDLIRVKTLEMEEEGSESPENWPSEKQYTFIQKVAESEELNQPSDTKAASATNKRRDGFREMAAIAVSMSRSNERDNSYFISIYSFLAFILKCLNVYKEHYDGQESQKGEPSDISERETCEAISKLITRSIPIKSCRNPEWLIERHMYGARDKSYNHESINPIRGVLKDIRHLKLLSRFLAYEIFKWCKESLHPKAKGDDLTPSKMGSIWSDLYYGLKHCGYHINAETLQPVYATGSGNERLKDYYGNICNFEQAMEFFISELSDTETGTLSTEYKQRIKDFPLTDHLYNAVKAFAELFPPIQTNNKDNGSGETASSNENP